MSEREEGRNVERFIEIRLADGAQDFVEAALDLLAAVEECWGLPYAVTNAAERLREVAGSRQW